MRAAKEFFMRGTTGEERFTNMMESLTNEDQKRLIFTLNWICNNNFSGFSTLNISHYRIISIEKWGDNISISQKVAITSYICLYNLSRHLSEIYICLPQRILQSVLREIFMQRR